MSDEQPSEESSALLTPPDGSSSGATAAKPAVSGELQEPSEGEFDAAWAVLEALTDPNY